jgi:DNA-binding transcriptional LysR family regulator
VNTANLKLFVDIAQQRSFVRGASLNRVSQSAASQHVQDIERELGFVLLDRSTRPLTVTPAGKLYFDYCRAVLHRREELEAALGALRSEVEGTVRVAAIYSVGLSEMSGLEHEFMERYPHARLVVDYRRPEQIYTKVLEDQADIGLVSYPAATRELTVIPWREEEMVVAASPYHPVGSMVTIRPEDLKGMDFISFDEDLPIDHAVSRYLEERGVHVRVVGRFDNIQTIKEAVERRLGVSIMPARVMQTELAQGRLVALSLIGAPLSRPLGIVHRRRKRFNRAAEAFLELLQEKPVPMMVGIE